MPTYKYAALASEVRKLADFAVQWREVTRRGRELIVRSEEKNETAYIGGMTLYE